jgi:hypothetical protein
MHSVVTLKLDNRVIVSGIWAVQMFIYLLGDILRIYSGDIRLLDDQPQHSNQWLFAAIIMLVPISMVLLSLLLPHRMNRVVNTIAALCFGLFIIADMGSYPGLYDRFLFAVSLGLYAGLLLFVARWNGKAV